MNVSLDPSLEGGQKSEENPNEDGVHLVQDAEFDDTGDEQGETIAGVAPGTIQLDPSGQVTYRVVHVTPQDGGEPQQALIQSPFSNGGGSPTAEALGGGETRFSYVPATVGSDGIATTAEGGASIAQLATGQGGQFFVVMNPQDVLDSQRQLAPRNAATLMTSQQVGSPTKTGGSRDGRRRATHNEVERRRRDKINNWIVQLSKLIPDCAGDHTKQGQDPRYNNVHWLSKGGILAKACEYITGLRNANARMAESLKDMEKLSVDIELQRQQCEELKQENVILRAQLQQHGIAPAEGATSVQTS